MSALLQIKISDLKPGMIVVRCDKSGIPFNEYGVPLTDAGKAEELASFGVRHVYIWNGGKEAPEETKKHDYSVPAGEDIPSVAIAAAMELAGKAKNTVNNAINNAKKGRPVDIETVSGIISDIIQASSDTQHIFASMPPITAASVDEEDCAHGLNVCCLALSMGLIMGLKQKDLMNLGIASVFHDVGKSRVPEKILKKNGPLSDVELTILKKHPGWGYEMLEKSGKVETEALIAIGQHHECCDGSGYPASLNERYIIKISKILAVAEAYETMLCGGTEYPGVQNNTDAVKRIYAGMGRQYSEDAVKAFVSVMGVYPVGTFVKLSDGNTAIVCEVNRKDQSRPKVILMGKDGKGKRGFMNLAKKQDIKVTSPANHAEYGIDPDSVFDDFLRERIRSRISG